MNKIKFMNMRAEDRMREKIIITMGRNERRAKKIMEKSKTENVV